ncbi:hypothetical protein [Tissierella sp. Yu-01]|uniref:hypothetical protein n=1 Tax=Tissierella sp. Yu-01 TaxID=3035694 RepID=UPI00240E6A48|nr:hypothetical protein [Tissierella sp. Yu-01]WFA10359.1 hypothetical protein P3962_07345 [Tissierella sp. Yu-01]
MDKQIQLCARSIVSILNGDIELSKVYQELALEEYDKNNSIAKVEDHVPRNIKRKLYELVS